MKKRTFLFQENFVFCLITYFVTVVLLQISMCLHKCLKHVCYLYDVFKYSNKFFTYRNISWNLSC